MPTYSTISGDDDRGSMTSSSRRRQYSRGKKDAGVVGQASWLSSIVNLLNTIIGAGVLAMPLALSHMGILLGVFVIIWAGITSAFGLYLQTRCARFLDRGSASFFALSQITYPNAAVIFDAAIAIKCFGVGVSYLIIIGDLMPGVVKAFSEDGGGLLFLVDRHFWITALLVIPLSFLRRLDSLKYTSVVALISIGYLVILVVYHFAKGDTLQYRGTLHIIRWGGAIPTLSSFPVIVFAYTCHQNMFSILNEIKNNSPRSTTSVVGASIGSAGFIYLLVAITGYLSFGDNVGGNVVRMYGPSAASTIAKVAIVILFVFSYPLQVHPCRASVDAVLKWRPIKRKSSGDNSDSSPSRGVPLLPPPKMNQHGRSGDNMSDTRFAAISTAIIVLSYIVAMTVSSLEAVLAYVGSTGSTSISFILPGLFYYKISDPDSPHQQKLLKENDEVNDDDDADEDGTRAEADEGLLGNGGEPRGKTSTWRKSILRQLSLALAIYGIVVMVVCFVTNTFFIVAH
ncbi:MAG: hypothetical protein M4579_002869 [Chaenotheca gracillima]|nr:MAG: hypothetical protein M4579_002869 [Chaenotheca gracillima]